MRNGVEHGGLSTVDEAKLLIDVARYLGAFVGQLFHLERETAALRERAQRDAEVARFKKEFVTKRMVRVA